MEGWGIKRGANFQGPFAGEWPRAGMTAECIPLKIIGSTRGRGAAARKLRVKIAEYDNLDIEGD